MKLIFIPSLAARNISATLLDGGMVELRPKAAVTENIRTVFRANKPAILEELRILGNTFSTDELALMAGCTAEDVALLKDIQRDDPAYPGLKVDVGCLIDVGLKLRDKQNVQ
ncbi:MAG TPA: hypothetical protein PLZ21_04205 [Armatimonadota bacterium]|nr:hypothetical protein [Armatimonadota bacterium]